MARKVVYERSGEPAQVIRVVASGEPQAPQRGQVLVRVTAFPVHPGDLAGIAGPFAGADGDALVPGAEATGTVEAVGPDTPVAAGVCAGARVTVFLVPGAWQDWVLAPSELVVAVPDDVPDAVAAQLRQGPRGQPVPGSSNFGLKVAEAGRYLATGRDAQLGEGPVQVAADRTRG